MWHMTEKQNNYGINVKVQSIIVRRGTERGLPNASLSSKEQGEPHSHEAWCHADSLNTCKVGRFTSDLTKVYGTGQLCGLGLGNCQTRVIENLAPSLTSVIIFCNTSYIFGINLYMVAVFPSLPCKKGILGTDL